MSTKRVSRPGEYSGYSERLYEGHELSSQYVAVRDGTKLAVDLFRPTEQDGRLVSAPLPVLWMHTPYNRRNFMGGLTAVRYPGMALRLVKYGYVVAAADFRGLYASFGKNVAFNRGEWIDAARWDAYDITEWLAAQPFCNGKVGMWGCSATGGSQLQAATTAPPHLKAIFPMSCEFDVYPFGVPGGVAPARGQRTSVPPSEVRPEQRDALAVPVDADTDKSMLAQAVAQHAGNIENAGYVPFRDSIAEKFPERWWIKSNPYTYLDELSASGIAMYVAANWDEGTTKQGVFFTFNNVENPVKVIVGPGTHCNWAMVKEQTGFDLVVEEHRFFDHWLKGIDNGVMDEPPVRYYTYHAPSGTEWRSATQWPLPTERRTRFYLGARTLSTSAPVASPGREGPSCDQVTVDYDVSAENLHEKGLMYQTEPLPADVQVTGHPVVELWISSSATDGDFVATLQDVAPDGKAHSYFVRGQLRASLRKLHEPPYDNLGLPWHRSHEEDAAPLVPGEPTLLTFDLLPISMVWKAGHRIRLVLTFASGAATAKLSPAPLVTVYRDRAYASTIILPIIEI